MQIKAAGWNVQGERNSGAALMDRSSENLPRLTHGVQELNAEVLVLSDTQGWRKKLGNTALLDIFGPLGFTEAMAIDLRDKRLDPDSGITILSKLAFKAVEIFRLYNRDALRVEVGKEKKQLQVVGAYGDDISEDTRLLQFQALPERVDIVDKPTALIGDKNAMHASDSDARPLGGGVLRASLRTVPLPGRFRSSSHPKLQKAVTIYDGIAEMERGETLAFLEELGLHDADPTHQPTMPAYAYVPPFFQLDHILINSGVRARDFEVHRRAWAVQVSDHYPISATLEVV